MLKSFQGLPAFRSRPSASLQPRFRLTAFIGESSRILGHADWADLAKLVPYLNLLCLRIRCRRLLAWRAGLMLMLTSALFEASMGRHTNPLRDLHRRSKHYAKRKG